jgi:hypothetical protein
LIGAKFMTKRKSAKQASQLQKTDNNIVIDVVAAELALPVDGVKPNGRKASFAATKKQ